MHVVIATDGNLHVEKTAELTSHLATDGGKVTVLTVVEVPRTMLTDLRAIYGESIPSSRIDTDAEYVGSPPTTPGVTLDWPGDDAMLERYVQDVAARRTDPIVEALAERGITAEVEPREQEDSASAIVQALDDLGADVVVVGTHGAGRFEGLLGGTGTKVARRAHCTVVLVR